MRTFLGKAGRLIGHILFLLLLFIGSLLVFDRMINQVTPDTASSMKQSSFPLVYMNRGGVNFNCLHGYDREMDVSRMRDCITPLSTERSIDIRIQTFSMSVDKVSFKVMTLDGQTTLENTQVIKLEKENDTLKATLKLQNKMLMNQEYMLAVCVTSGGRNIWYYTHVLLADGLHADEYLNFVSGFYDKTVNKSDLGTVGAAVEPDETTDAERTLAFMDIHDSVDQLTWGTLNPQIFYKPTPRITEINTKTGTLTTEYRIAAVSESGATEVYNVKEYYRVRFTDSRVFLLNFERTTDEVFNPEDNVMEKKGIRLGVTGQDVVYRCDPKNRVIAFVQENELWTYENATSKLTQVFGFPQKENMDYRDFYDAHTINILRVDSSGDVWFTVAGYMNRGSHEGENGVSVCFYEAATDMVDELVFIESAEPWELLIRDSENSGYVTEDESLYYMLLDEKLIRVNLSSRMCDVIADQIHENCYASSASGRFFAYLKEGEEYGSGTLIRLDLESESEMTIEAESGERVRPVCFMNEDLVYGLATDKDLAIASVKTGLFPMYRMVFVNPEGQVVKDYRPNGRFVTDVVISDNMLDLTRVETNVDHTGYAESDPDQIVFSDTHGSVAVGIGTVFSERKQTQVLLRIGGEISDQSPEIIRSKVVSYESSHSIAAPVNETPEKLFWVYAGGKLVKRFSRPNEAIVLADAKVGVVVDSSLNYVWVRGDRDNSLKMEASDAPQSMRDAQADKADLEEKSGQGVLDLTGCTLDEILYFVGHRIPVLAQGENGPVVIVGYDEYNTCLLGKDDEEWYYYGINDSTDMFKKAGNRFFVLERQDEK